MKNYLKDQYTGRFQPGTSGGGRKAGSRNKISQAFINELCEDFEQHGKAVIAKVREDKPDQYLKIIASIIPKDIDLNSDDQIAYLTDAELNEMLEFVTEELEQHKLALADNDGE